MKMPHIRSILAAMIAAVALGAANPARASNFTVTSSTSGSSARFIVTRDNATAAETVRYRTVSLSAYAGQHFTSATGTLTFPAGQTAVTNFVTERTPSTAAYKFQTSPQRSYRFELTDEGGFPITDGSAPSPPARACFRAALSASRTSRSNPANTPPTTMATTRTATSPSPATATSPPPRRERTSSMSTRSCA